MEKLHARPAIPQRLARLVAQITAGEDWPAAKTVAGKVGHEVIQFRALTKADDTSTTMDGVTKGFQRIKLPAPMASVVPVSLRQWQREATTASDPPGPVAAGQKGKRVQVAIKQSNAESMSMPIHAKDPDRVMATWDNKDTLRIHLYGMQYPLIRQSSVLAKGETAGASTANGAHTDSLPVLTEFRVRREMAERLGCSLDDVVLQSGQVATLLPAARAMGVSRSDINDDAIIKLMEKGVLQWTRMWMSPNSAAQPLAFLDCATVDWKKYMNGDHLIVGFEQGKFFPDYTKPHMLTSWPKDIKPGQIQFTYQPDAAHKWYYFQDLSEDEAVIFAGAGYTFHTAFTPMTQFATEERVSAEMSNFCMVVRTNDQRSMEDCAEFLSAIRNKDGQLVFCGETSGERNVDAARTFIERVIEVTK